MKRAYGAEAAGHVVTKETRTLARSASSTTRKV
jgi:hypothetical protein